MFPLQPQFFDIFGAIGFIYIVIFSLLSLYGKTPSRWMLFLLLLIGVIGLIVDGFVVWTFYL